MQKFFVLLCISVLAACTTPADVSVPLGAGGDKNAKFSIKDTAQGFTVDLRYSRYQFVPEADALLVACKSIATNRAYEEAKLRGKEIQPINEQNLRVSVGRNIISARTACRALVDAVYK